MDYGLLGNDLIFLQFCEEVVRVHGAPLTLEEVNRMLRLAGDPEIEGVPGVPTLMILPWDDRTQGILARARSRVPEARPVE